MAGNVFRRFLEIVLDKDSAKKTERDTQAALGRATDPKTASINLDKVGRAVSNVTRLFLQAGAAVVGYALAITRLTERGGQLLNVQRAFSNVVGDADAAIIKLREATGGLISDYDLMVGFNKALSMGAVQTIDQFAEMSNVAQQLGRALGVDATFAMESLTLGVSRGSRLILDNLGIVVKGAVTVESAMAAARETVERLGGGSATTADMLARVVIQFGNLRDEVGKFLAQSQTLKTAFFEVGNILEMLILALQTKDRDAAVQAFKSVGALLGTVFAASFFDGISGLTKWLEEQFGLLAFPISKTIGKLAEKAAASAWDAADAQVVAADALGRQLEAEIALRKVREGIVTSQTQLEAGPRGLPTFDTSRSIAGPAIDAMGGGITFPDELILESRTNQFNMLVDAYRTGFSNIESAGQTAALGIQNAFQSAFLALNEEGNAFGNFLEAIFRGSAAAALTAIAQLATSKVVENIAYAFEDSAKASAAFAMGNPFSGALFAAAAKSHVLAAAKWGLVGGVAGAAAAAVSGGGGGSSFRGSDVVGRQVDKLDRAGAVVNVYVDGFDPMNPRHQRLAYDGVARAAQSAGPNARVNILPRGSA